MMRRVLMVAILGLLPCVALADDGGGQPLICYSTYEPGVPTFFPRGDHFALGGNRAIVLSFNPAGPTVGNQANPPSGAAAQAAVAAAAHVWASAVCSNNATPNLTFSPTGTWNGNTIVSGDQINAIIWQNHWAIDSGTVAGTTNTYESDTGLTVDADIQFNAQDFNWRVTGSGAGCNAAMDANCYDIETVSVHEFGHFLGFNHVACQTAVMFPSAAGSTNNNQLSSNEVAGVCALYPPHPASSTGQMGEICATTNDCASGLLCLKPAGGTATGLNGWCTMSCTNSSDCPVAFICDAVTSQGPTCVPGIHLPNVPADNVTMVQDMCQPCGEGANCSANLCVLNPNGGICSQPCSTDGAFACPAGFACIQTGTSNVCYPVDNTVCPATWQGVKYNQLCYSPEVNHDPNSALSLPCEAGLNCIPFPGGQGACLQYCDAVTAGASCPAGYECCFGFDATGKCLNSSASAGSGGCIQVQPTGASCTLPSQSVCNANATCFYASQPTLAECYDTCANGTCPTAGETCAQFPLTSGATMAICCDSTYYNGDPNTCRPKAGVCQRETDVTCTQNSDCQSGLCQTYNNKSFCSIPCVLNSDCPGTFADVNGDGKPDGGGTCTTIGNQKLCVPTTTPAGAPACATPATNAGKGGCSCASTGPGDLLWLAMVLLVATRRWQRA